MNMFSQDVGTLASVDGNNRTALMNAARQLAGAFTDLLNVTKPGSEEVRSTTAEFLLTFCVLSSVNSGFPIYFYTVSLWCFQHLWQMFGILRL